MSTQIRPEISKDKPFYIPKHRYYELKHFCLQYPDLKAERERLLKESTRTFGWLNSIEWSDSTANRAARLESVQNRVSIIEESARTADMVLSNYILRGVTLGETYEQMKVKSNIPCGRDYYYELYRKFFWILDSKRQ